MHISQLILCHYGIIFIPYNLQMTLESVRELGAVWGIEIKSVLRYCTSASHFCIISRHAFTASVDHHLVFSLFTAIPHKSVHFYFIAIVR